MSPSRRMSNARGSSRCCALSCRRSSSRSRSTRQTSVARFAADQGVAFINDVWGLQKDPAMADVVAETETGVVIMHNREETDRDCDIIADMRRFSISRSALRTKPGSR